MKNLKNPSNYDVSRRTATSKNKPTYDDYINTRLHADKMLYYNKSAAHDFALNNKELVEYADFYLKQQPKEEDLQVFDRILNAAYLNEIVEADELTKQQLTSPFCCLIGDYVVPYIGTCRWIAKKCELGSGNRDLYNFVFDKLLDYFMRAWREAKKSEQRRYSGETDD